MRQSLITIGIFLFSCAIIAQEAVCPTPERAAIAEARIWCADVVMGEACYGNSGLRADLASDVTFNTAGDTVAVFDITQITSINENNQYGIAQISTTGYAPDNWLAQDVTLVTLGDVTIANTGNEMINLNTVTTQITAAGGANVRSGPSGEFRILTPLFFDDTIKITGRLADDSFYRVQLPSGENGWIISSVVDAIVSELPLVDRGDTLPEQIYAPFTSFSLQTGFNDAACSEAWQSGVLLQASLDNRVRIRLNETEISVSGTVFLQADADADVIHVIEGFVRYQDEIIQEGYTLAIVADVSQIFTYDIATFAPLPTEILPRYTYIGIDLAMIITPAPTIDRSPIADVLVDAPCVITTGQDGANLRAGPNSAFPIRGVLAYRETVNPISRVIGSDGTVWYEIAQNVWVTNQVIVTGGDCVSVPQSQRIPALLPTSTPDN